MFGRAAAIGLIAGAVVVGRPALAQAGSTTEIEISLGGGASHGGSWDGSWSPGPSGVFGVAAPYGPGLLRLGVRGYFNQGVAEPLPDFITLHADAAWGPVVGLPAGIRAVPEVHVGMVAFLFDDDEVDEPLRNESELAAGLGARVDGPLWGSVRGWVGVDAAHIFTRPSETVMFVEGGLSLGVSAPAWLRRVAR